MVFLLVLEYRFLPSFSPSSVFLSLFSPVDICRSQLQFRKRVSVGLFTVSEEKVVVQCSNHHSAPPSAPACSSRAPEVSVSCWDRVSRSCAEEPGAGCCAEILFACRRETAWIARWSTGTGAVVPQGGTPGGSSEDLNSYP